MSLYINGIIVIRMYLLALLTQENTSTALFQNKYKVDTRSEREHKRRRCGLCMRDRQRATKKQLIKDRLSMESFYSIDYAGMVDTHFCC